MSTTLSSFRPIWDTKDVALLVIDYQPGMFASLKSGDPKLVELNVKYLIRMAKALDIPVVLSSVGVEMGFNTPTVAGIADELPGEKIYDRSSMDAWEDEPFVNAIKATGKKRLVIVALYTEICHAFTVVEALAAGYEVMILTDAVGGLSIGAHDRAIERMTEAGAILNTTFAYQAELFRDWKSPLVAIVHPISTWYTEEFKKLTGTSLMTKA